MRKFKYAGVSKVGGQFTLRATNRELPVYPQLLEREGNTAINIIELDKPMTKDQIREHLAKRKAFRTPPILAALRKETKQPAAKKRVAAKKASPARKRTAVAKKTEPAQAAA